MCGPGDALVQAVAKIVRAAKERDPFQPVVVIVQRGRQAVQLRRSLARALGGVINVEVTTPGRLVAARVDADHTRPAAPAAIAAAVARAARSTSGPLTASSRQPATIVSLMSAYNELRAVAPARLTALGRRGPLGAQLAQIVANAHQQLRASRRADEVDGLSHLAAAVGIDEVGAGGDTAPVVITIVDEPLSPAMIGALTAVVAGAASRLVIALSGDPVADEAMLAAAAPLSPTVELGRESVADGGVAAAPSTLRVSSSTDPDAEVADAVRWLVDHLRASVPGTLAALLWTADQPYRRIVAEHLQRAGLDWSGPAAGSLIETETGRSVQRAAQTLADAERLVTSGVVGSADPGEAGPAGVLSSWADWADWAAHLAPLAVGEPAVATVVADLAGLDGLDDFAAGRATELLTLVLDTSGAQHGTMSRGLTAAPLTRATLVGRYIAVAVVGVAEGWAPAAEPAGGLLTNDDRAVVGLAPPSRADDQRRALATVVGSADHVLVSWPRADLRRTAERAPSRWLEPLAAGAARAGSMIDHAHRPSHLGALIGDGAGTPAEHRVLLALTAPDVLAGEDHVFGRALTAARGRAAPVPGPFDGNLASEDLTSLRQRSTPWTATELEAYAACPRTYFIRHVLRVGENRSGDDLLREDGRAKGSSAHDVLHQLVRRERDGERLGLAALIDAAEDLLRQRELTTAHASGAPRLLRDHRRAELARRLALTIVHDRAARCDAGREPIDFEMSFGDRGDIVVDLVDGRALPIRGRIDRVDRYGDGSLAVVDYKTGRVTGFSDDPLDGGGRLQLAMYAVGAAAALAATTSFAEYRVVDAIANVRPIAAGKLLANLSATVTMLVDAIESGWFVAPLHEPRAPGQPVCAVCDPHGLFSALLSRRFATLVDASTDAFGDGDGEGDAPARVLDPFDLHDAVDAPDRPVRG